jgi:hypothetical protein
MKISSSTLALAVILSSCSQPVPAAGESPLISKTIDSNLQALGQKIIKHNLTKMNLKTGIEDLVSSRTDFKDLKPVLFGAQFIDMTGCVKYTGDTKDLDGDGIGKNFTATYNCSYQSVSGMASVAGSVIVQDANDEDAKSGFARSVNNIRFVIQSSNKTYSINESLNFTSSVDYSNYNGSVNSTITIDGTTSTTTSSLRYNPFEPKVPFDKGELQVDGKSLLVDKTGASESLLLKSNGLSITNQCGDSGYIQNGSISYTRASSRGTVQTMVYKECAATF